MNAQEFDQALSIAARGVDFGPLSGFGGHGSRAVFAALPEPVRGLYEKWRLPRELLTSRNAGPALRAYAERCGIDVTADLAGLEVAP